ncbi:hypothetical protein [Bradyrhizobium sp. Ai1a-2]|uniref:hypothetical protein n=1 Tax=Bradyrhizobium sp. Ai1a-2 TaxID=196490 RepID=UPI0004042E44|nr:hypothetical protein [Bradyrhizobium sp. Ai1a-2]
MTAPRDPNLIVDDLGFRAAELEKIVQLNIHRLHALARSGATAEQLRQAVQDLHDDTCNQYLELQTKAVERLLVQQRAPAKILQFSPPCVGHSQPKAVS